MRTLEARRNVVHEEWLCPGVRNRKLMGELMACLLGGRVVESVHLPLQALMISALANQSYHVKCGNLRLCPVLSSS